MILKLKTRKNIYSAKQLVNYLLSDKGKIKTPFDEYTYLQNINRLSLRTLHRDFLDNHKFQKKRKGSTALYHEILSIHKEDRDRVTSPMLRDLAQTYIRMRGVENAIVLSRVHFEEHIHIHFMISSNEYRSEKRLRMSKKQMKDLLRDFESYHQSKYPELSNSIVHLNKPQREKTNYQKEDQNRRRENEYQMKQRTGKKPSQKQKVYSIVERLMSNASNFEELVRTIQQENEVQIYSYRGKIKGVIFQKNGRKFRFTTLGFTQDRIQQIDKVQSRLEQLSLVRETFQGKERGRGRS